jgi:hypothetical protein
MKFSDVKNRTCLYLLGGIAGLEGSVLNIITTKDDKLFFEFCNDYDELGLDEDTMYAFPIEAYLPIYILQETTMKEIENILNEDSLNKNDYEGPLLNEIMQLEGNPIYLEKEIGDDAEYFETSWTNKYIQSRMEDWLYAWKRTRLLDGLNWNFDYKPKDKTILQLVLEDMTRTED